MNYRSTRNSAEVVSSAQAIAMGISKDGGLFVPETIPQMPLEEIGSLIEENYVQRAEYILAKFLTDFSMDELGYCVRSAYTAEKFGSDKIAELARLGEGTGTLAWSYLRVQRYGAPAASVPAHHFGAENNRE